MRENNRGFSFLVGALGILLLIRLSVLGILQQVSDYVLSWVFAGWDIPFLRTSEMLAVSPAAVISDLIVELTVLLGTIAILSTKGVWSVLLIAGSWTGDFATTILQFLRITTLQRQTSVVPPQPRAALSDASVTMILLTLQQQAEQLAAITRHIGDLERRQLLDADIKPTVTATKEVTDVA